MTPGTVLAVIGVADAGLASFGMWYVLPHPANKVASRLEECALALPISNTIILCRVYDINS